jgi:hypothetical protein
MTRRMKCKNVIFNTGSIRYLHLTIILALLVPLSVAPLSSAVADRSELIKLITNNEDPIMNVNDLAFLLVTHDFDATPRKYFVEVNLNKTVYKLVPNGPYPGLANMTFES